MLSVLMHSRVLPADRRDPEKVSRNRGLLKGPFSILDQTLADHEFLAGNRFTVADLNVAAVLSWCKPARLPLPITRIWTPGSATAWSGRRARPHSSPESLQRPPAVAGGSI
ncbi:MAG: glutathione S-transferase C-terminal domain-containing protein [Chromatiaceae bacterium]|nr:glutathione S-transferase C-terminal domain-containing protein [Chromatiaceae bacterium]